MRAILLSRKDFKRSAADEAAGRPPVDDARWREVPTYTFTLLPTACYTCYLPLATCHLPLTHYLLARGVRPGRGCGGAAGVGGALG